MLALLVICFIGGSWVCLPRSWLVGWLSCWLGSQLAGWLVGSSVRWLVDWLSALMACLVHTIEHQKLHLVAAELSPGWVYSVQLGLACVIAYFFLVCFALITMCSLLSLLALLCSVWLRKTALSSFARGARFAHSDALRSYMRNSLEI